MKRNEVGGIFNFLARVPVNKIEPRQLRNNLCILHVALKREQDNLQKDLEALREKFFEGKMDRMGEYADLVDSIRLAKTIAERNAISARINKDYAAEKQLDKEYGEAQKAILEEDAVNVPVKTYDMDEFFAAMGKVNIEITGRDLSVLTPILDISGGGEKQSSKKKK